MKKFRYITIQLEGKDLRIQLTEPASRALADRSSPLNVEMELYFSCMIRKRVHFTDEKLTVNYAAKTDQLEIGFRPIMAQRCSIQDVKETPPTTDFPISRAGRFIPNWLNLDFTKGKWSGEFGYVQ